MIERVELWEASDRKATRHGHGHLNCLAILFEFYIYLGSFSSFRYGEDREQRYHFMKRKRALSIGPL